MPFSSGTFTRTFDCTTDRDNGVKILASKFDTEFDGIATGLSTCILKDGTQTCTAAIPFAEGLTVPDSKKIVIGTGADMEIFHDGLHSRIADVGSGDLKIGTSGGAVRITANGVTDDMIVANQGGTVTLSHSGTTKLTTSSSGITVAGEVDATSLDISGDADIDGTLEADAMTLNGTAITATATLDTGISNNNVPKFTSGVADDDFLRVDGTAIEGRSASEVLSDIAALPLAGGSMTGAVTITTADNDAQLILKTTDADAAVGPFLDMIRDSASPADNDTLGRIRFRGDNDAGEAFTYGTITSKITDASDGTEGGLLTFLVGRNGSVTSALDLNESETVFNEGGLDADFRVEGASNANLFFVDAGNDKIGVGTNTPDAILSALSTSGTTTDIGRFEAAVGSYTGTSLVAANTLGPASSFNLFKCTTDSDADAGGPFTEFVVRGDGHVGVGTDNPQSLTHFKGTSSGQNILHLDNSAGSGHGDTNNNVRVVAGNNGYWANLVIAGHQLEFKVQGGTSMLRVDSDGVKFNGDTAAANALDDYEESTYSFNERHGQATITTHRCRVVKIGALVYIDGSFTVGSNSNGNNLNINLPFTSTIGTNGLGGGSIGFSNLSATIVEANLRPNLENLADNLFFRYGQNNLVTCSDASGKRIDFNVWYPVL